MAELGKKLGKLNLAILENFVEKTLGNKFVDELRAPTDRALAIDKALENTEKRFQREFDDRVFAEKIFTQVNDRYLGLLAEAVGKFFDHPTETDFQNMLVRIVRDSFPYIEEERVSRAVQQYVTILTEECALADASFREKVRGLADLHGEKSQQEMVDILRRVEALLAVREMSQVVPSAFRSLHQLPQPPADFTGREELIAQLVRDFEHGEGATISGLTGMGGIGKTSVGLMVAHQVAKDYPDAQIFLDLKGTTTPLSVSDVMRHVVLSFEPTMDVQALDEPGVANAYRSVLHGKRALLFLDNARSSEQIASLHPPETCALLVTSRWNFAVPGLHSRRVDLMSEENAAAFLLELCPRIREKVDELAGACAYLPLALRIAGSFLQVNADWSIDKYLTQLHDRKGRLAALKQSRERAELTTEPDLLATFELSYQELSDENKKHWRGLGVFPASFAANAAGAIWGLDEEETAKTLGLLLRYNLLDYNEASSRYSLHDLLADYAITQMKTEDEQEARLKYASHYRDILRLVENLYKRGGERILIGLRLLDLEWENIRTGHAWVTVAVGNDPALSELCLAYLDVGTYVLSLRQHPKEQIHWLETALAVAREIGDRRGEGNALGGLGLAYSDLGDVHKAIEFHKQRLAIVREIGDRRVEGIALGNLGTAYRNLGDARKAIEYYEPVLVIAREISDRRVEEIALSNLGIAYADLGEMHKAITYHEQALLIARDFGDRLGEANARGNLGSVYKNLGDTRKAIEYHEQALVNFREIGDRHGEGNALSNLGIAYKNLGDARKAIEYYEQALVIAREIGDRRSEGNALGNLGTAHRNLGESHKAITYLEQRLVIAREIGDRRGEGAALGNLGNAYTDLRQTRKAIEYYKGHLAIAREIGDRLGEGNALGNLGTAYYNLRQSRKAIEYYEEQLAIVRKIGDRRSEGNALFNMGLAWYDLRHKNQAINLAKQALHIYEAVESPYVEGTRKILREWGAEL